MKINKFFYLSNKLPFQCGIVLIKGTTLLNLRVKAQTFYPTKNGLSVHSIGAMDYGGTTRVGKELGFN